jgi:hypothetical protein
VQFAADELHEAGEGVTKDDAEAANGYRNAAEHGVPDAIQGSIPLPPWLNRRYRSARRQPVS